MADIEVLTRVSADRVGNLIRDSLTWSELDARIEAAADGVAALVAPGDRVVVALAQDLDFVVTLFGCFRARAVAVPAYPPGGLRHTERLAAVLEDCGARLCVVADDPERARPALRTASGDGLLVRSFDELTRPVEAGRGVARPWPEPSDLAYLQYSSGSTRSPGA